MVFTKPSKAIKGDASVNGDYCLVFLWNFLLFFLSVSGATFLPYVSEWGVKPHGTLSPRVFLRAGSHRQSG